MRRYVMMTPMTRNPGTLDYRRLTFTQAEEWLHEERFVCTIGWKKVTIALHLLFGCAFHKTPCPANTQFVLEPGDEALLVLLEEGPHEEAFYALKIPWILEHARFALVTMVNEVSLVQESPTVPLPLPVSDPVAIPLLLPQPTIAQERQLLTVECVEGQVDGVILERTALVQDGWSTFSHNDLPDDADESDEDEGEEQVPFTSKRARNRKKHTQQRRRGTQWQEDEDVYA